VVFECSVSSASIGCSVSGSLCFTEPPPVAIVESLRLPHGHDVFGRTNSHPREPRPLTRVLQRKTGIVEEQTISVHLGRRRSHPNEPAVEKCNQSARNSEHQHAWAAWLANSFIP
jgi:hypothetical protein